MADGGADAFRVVLVDDVPDLRALLRAALESSGRFTVVAEAADGRSGIDAVRDAQPDLVLLDVSMPVMDGLEALPHVVGAAPDATVVVLSGFEQARVGSVAVSLGAAAYIEKGLPPRRLVKELLRLLEPAA